LQGKTIEREWLIKKLGEVSNGTDQKRFAKRGKAPSSVQCNSLPAAASGIVEPNNLHNIEQKYQRNSKKSVILSQIKIFPTKYAPLVKIDLLDHIS
jgi:hypothetical protein